ncbi:endonuclease domain-containing protein [Microbacterium sp. NPDC057650]|uniref:endonuclease domain-containing protein n=1 Tax=unclassified Microbacterium TaxID=2609290 RepID=UPI00366E9F6D
MRHRIELPQHLGEHFSVREAQTAGIGAWRSSTPDLERPFRGVRSKKTPETFLARAECYSHRMRLGHRYVGATAMRVWGIPHPSTWTAKEPIHVAVPRETTPPKITGVKGRRLDKHRARTSRVHGLPVVDPIAAVFSTAHELTIAQIITALDAILTTCDNYPGLYSGKPLITIAEIEERLAEWTGFAGRGKVRAALPLARLGVESPKETETRLLLIGHGLPEPVVQHEVRDPGRLIARVDLAYPELKIAIEYEGDGHRTSKDQWRADIRRQRDLEDRGWIVIRLTQADLKPSGQQAFLARVRGAIASRTR